MGMGMHLPSPAVCSRYRWSVPRSRTARSWQRCVLIPIPLWVPVVQHGPDDRPFTNHAWVSRRRPCLRPSRAWKTYFIAPPSPMPRFDGHGIVGIGSSVSVEVHRVGRDSLLPHRRGARAAGSRRRVCGITARPRAGRPRAWRAGAVRAAQWPPTAPAHHRDQSIDSAYRLGDPM